MHFFTFHFDFCISTKIFSPTKILSTESHSHLMYTLNFIKSIQVKSANLQPRTITNYADLNQHDAQRPNQHFAYVLSASPKSFVRNTIFKQHVVLSSAIKSESINSAKIPKYYVTDTIHYMSQCKKIVPEMSPDRAAAHSAKGIAAHYPSISRWLAVVIPPGNRET